LTAAGEACGSEIELHPTRDAIAARARVMMIARAVKVILQSTPLRWNSAQSQAFSQSRDSIAAAQTNERSNAVLRAVGEADFSVRNT
jgi:hypothetical protein